MVNFPCHLPVTLSEVSLGDPTGLAFGYFSVQRSRGDPHHCVEDREDMPDTREGTQFHWAVASGAQGLWGRGRQRRCGGGQEGRTLKEWGRLGDWATFQGNGGAQASGGSGARVLGASTCPTFAQAKGRPDTARSGRGGRKPASAVALGQAGRRPPESQRLRLPPPSLLASAPSPLLPQPSRPETRRAPLRGSFGYPGGGNPSADWEAAALARDAPHFLLQLPPPSPPPPPPGSPHRLLLFLLLLCLEASFSAAERSAMSGKFREGLEGAMLPGLCCRRPRATLCMR